MYRPIKIQATNFQSFETLSYDFQIGKAILIEGENRTDEGQATNGSGKSSFGEAIYYCLLGSSSTGKRDIKLVRRGNKQSTLSLTLKNEYLKQELKIDRTLFSNSKPSILEIYINGQSQKDRFSSVTEGNKLILELLDISAEDLKNYYLISSKRFVSFFDSPDSSKRALLARFSNIDKIQNVSTEIDGFIAMRQNKIESLSSNLVAINSKIELLKSQIEETNSKSFYEEKKRLLEEKISSCLIRINAIDEEIQKLNIEEFNKSRETKEQEKKLSSLNEEIKSLLSIDFEAKLSENSSNQVRLQEKIDKLREEKRNVLNEANSLNCDMQPILVLLEGIVTCPNCKTEFSVADKSLDINEAKQIVKETQETINVMKQQAIDLQNKIEEQESSSIMKQLQEERKRILSEKEATNNKILLIKKTEILPITAVLNTLEKEMDTIKRSRILLMSEQASCERNKLELQKELNSLSTDTTNPDIQKWNLMIEELDKNGKSISREIEELENKNLKERLWKERINQFYVYLTNKTLSLIQSHCNHYLSSINSNLSIKFEGFKTLADGKIKESINAVISRDGQEEEDYRCFSGGEQGRLIFSTILTYQELINQKSKSGGLDFVLVDEVLDKVDSMGLGLFVKSLSPLNKTVFIVSQVKTEAPIENTLLIVKEKGISSICSE